MASLADSEEPDHSGESRSCGERPAYIWVSRGEQVKDKEMEPGDEGACPESAREAAAMQGLGPKIPQNS